MINIYIYILEFIKKAEQIWTTLNYYNKNVLLREKNTTSKTIWKIPISLRSIKVQTDYQIYKLFTREK